MEGVALTAASTLTAGLSGGGVYSVVYTWLDPQRKRYSFSYGSPWYLAGLVHALRGYPLLHLFSGAVAGRHSGRCHGPSRVGVVFVIKYLFWAWLCIKHIHIICRSWVWGGPSQVAATFNSSYAWNWGPQELAYSYVPTVGKPVDSFRLVGDSSKANCCSFGRRSSLSPVYLSWLPQLQ